MELKIYAVYDSKAESFANPFFFNTKGEALRAWSEACNDDKSPFWKHPSDYTMFEIGSYDNATGRISGNATPIPLGMAQEFKQTTLRPVNPNQGMEI